MQSTSRVEESTASIHKKTAQNKSYDNPTNPNYGVVIGGKHSTQSLMELAEKSCSVPWYYSLVIGLLSPLYRAKVWQRSRHNDNYRQEVADRFGQRYDKLVAWDVKGIYQLNTVNSDAVNNDTVNNDAVNNNAVNKNSTTPKNKSLSKKPLSSKKSLSKKPLSKYAHTAQQPKLSEMPIIWCHAVSLGETNTIAPVLERLMAEGCRIWMTNTTQTGYQRVKQRFAEQIELGQLQHGYVPIDTTSVMDKFLNHVQPKVALFVETELWANTLYQLSKRGIASILMNARLSEQSFLSYQKIARISQSMMQNLSLIIAQDAESAKRFRMLGADSAKIRVAGSLKWTVNSGVSTNANEIDTSSDPADLKTSVTTDLKKRVQQAIGSRPVWVAASTHEGEEAVALATQQRLIATAHKPSQSPLLILVPRHPERFDEVAKQVTSSGLSLSRRSSDELPESHTQVYLADSMGELKTWYELADVSFVGGSLVNIGGHNPIESLAMATPVIMGQFTQSCQAIVDELKQEGVLKQLSPSYQHQKGKPLEIEIQKQLSDALCQQLKAWLDDTQSTERLGKLSQQLVAEKQSVIDRQLQMVVELLG